MSDDRRGDRSHGPAPPEDRSGDRSHGPAPPEDRSGDRSHGPAPASELRRPENPGHEPADDVSIPTIVRFGVGLGIATAVISLAMWGLFRFFAARQEKRDEPVPPMVAANLRRTPSGPRLEPNPLAPRRAARAREDAVLESYGWVDRNAGIARIPIDRAMELLVDKGLPPSKPIVAPPVAVPTPRSQVPGPRSPVGVPQ